jgi:uncharacterized protein
VADDRRRVAELLGREPRGSFDVVVRDESGDPVVVRNAPLLDDGTPMPTRYWLVAPRLVAAVSRLESVGAVRRAEAELDAAEIAAAHARYAAERDAQIDPDHEGPRPSSSATRRRSSATVSGGGGAAARGGPGRCRRPRAPGA